jgi:tRNA threonylcarbamoyladenosine biosynthesis protein TsaB
VSYIINIDTAVEISSVCLSFNEECVALKISPTQKESASWIQPAIKTLLAEQKVSLNKIAAVSLSNGPGSYTGLRVGMATAKGLCYALNIPLITINTLKMMAVSAIHEKADFYCPMIDARRMEVFTATYDRKLNEITPAHNLIIKETSFAELLQTNKILFFGNGNVKFKEITKHSNALFLDIETNAKHLVPESFYTFNARNFTEVAYSEPFYGKEFYSLAAKPMLPK